MRYQTSGDEKKLVLGTLHLKIISGVLHRNTEAFGKMDPFVVVEYNGQKYRTKTIQESNIRPVWNQSFEILIFNKDKQIKFSCQEEDIASNDDLGKADFDISTFLTQQTK